MQYKFMTIVYENNIILDHEIKNFIMKHQKTSDMATIGGKIPNELPNSETALAHYLKTK